MSKIGHFILDNFRRADVLRVAELLLSNDDDILTPNWSLDLDATQPFLVLSYEPMFHRICIYEIAPKGSIFDSSPYWNYSMKMQSEDDFIKLCVPNSTYHDIMNQDEG